MNDAVDYIKSLMPQFTGSIGIITGSGWDLRNILDNVNETEYKDIPGFPIPAVGGHRGRLLHGYHDDEEVLLLQGRVHYYEGYSMEEITLSVRVLAGLGIRQIIVTNAAGGIRPDFGPGDFMVVTDHINLMGVNPLRATPDTLCFNEADNIKERFVDMTEAYDQQLCSIALTVAKKHNIPLHAGILAAVSGPSYETPAEIRMLRSLGADAVCMSSVPEVIMSKYLGMKVLAISMITNHAAGVSKSVLRHEDVVTMAESRSKDASQILSSVITNLPR
ncbi:MAG: purine-nucleoside phosphorylase [Nitrospirae bacterium]|nr:purine-nucleoside phosphorylase [Nitrospirota bacterium]